MTKVINQHHGDLFAVYNADCIPFMQAMPERSVDISVFSPPFANLYTYSDSERDMGNCDDPEHFMEFYDIFAKELFRVMKSGRNAVVHCKELIYYQNQSKYGYPSSGFIDFPGMIIQSMRKAGFDYHARITIWRSPVLEMQKTKNHRLLYKNLRDDSAYAGVGSPEYFLCFKRWPRSEADPHADPIQHTKDEFPLDVWQEVASPVWMTTRQTDVLNCRMKADSRDERHICPMPLDLTRRALALWSAPGEVCFSPFTGIGSEGVASLQMKRKFIGTELKEEYFALAVKFLKEQEAIMKSGTLFDFAVNGSDIQKKES